jgi:hypothetical protein
MTIGHFERNFQVPRPSCTGLANLSVGQVGPREAVENQFNEFSSCFATRPVQLPHRYGERNHAFGQWRHQQGSGNSRRRSGVSRNSGTRPDFDYLEAGESLEEFLAGFPGVSREMTIAALEEARSKKQEARSKKQENCYLPEHK